MSSLLLTVYIVTAVISIVIALLLVNLARLSSQAKIREDRKAKARYLASAIFTDDGLKQAIFEEISEVEESLRHSQEVTDRLSDIFNKELEKKIEKNTGDLTKKYDNIIKEKSQHEEIAWKKYKNVLASKKETEAVIRSIAEGLVVVDSKGRVVMMNPAAEKLLGVSNKDKIGRPILENLKKEQLVSFSKETPEGEGKEIEIISQEDETRKIIRSSSAVLEDENGQTVGMVSVLSDITKQRELDQLKSDFVSKVSHELRTPIVTVQNSLSLLLSKTPGALSQSQEKFLTIAQRNLSKLAHLIDDLLDLSKLEASKMELKFISCSVEKIIDEVCDNLGTWASSKGIKITKMVQRDIQEVNLDYDKIIQVLINIVGNAIKFTPKDGLVAVEAALDEDKKNLVVGIVDTGIGIPREELSRVFDKFHQIGERVATDIGGTGLGLSIAKEIVLMHGGKIWAESEKGRGAKFTFTLPLDRTKSL